MEIRDDDATCEHCNSVPETTRVEYSTRLDSTRYNDFTFLILKKPSFIAEMENCDIFVLTRNISVWAFVVALGMSRCLLLLVRYYSGELQRLAMNLYYGVLDNTFSQ